MDELSLIWYAVYGSNLLEERFNCYLQGGKPTGSNKLYYGCRDKTLSKRQHEFKINSELYFAKKSTNWENGGVAFIDFNKNNKSITLSKIYLISKEQFIDVAIQETSSNILLDLDFNKTIQESYTIYKKKSWYGKLVHLGEFDNFPVFTITSEHKFAEINKPSVPYLITIIKGLRELYTEMDSKNIVKYLRDKEGIINYYTVDELNKVVDSI